MSLLKAEYIFLAGQIFGCTSKGSRNAINPGYTLMSKLNYRQSALFSLGHVFNYPVRMSLPSARIEHYELPGFFGRVTVGPYVYNGEPRRTAVVIKSNGFGNAEFGLFCGCVPNSGNETDGSFTCVLQRLPTLMYVKELHVFLVGEPLTTKDDFVVVNTNELNDARPLDLYTWRNYTVISVCAKG